MLPLFTCWRFAWNVWMIIFVDCYRSWWLCDILGLLPPFEWPCCWPYSAIHKATSLTVHGRSEPKHTITHARSCEKNGTSGCEITVPLSAFPYPFFSTQKSHRTERPPGVILYGGFASFSVPIGWILHVITHSNMASSLEKNGYCWI